MENSILSNWQWGFRSAHSTALALIHCTNNWLIGIDNGKINSTILLDVKKAFENHIDHDTTEYPTPNWNSSDHIF